MPSLSSDLRRKLENTVIQARDIAEEGAKHALFSLAVHEANYYSHMNEEQKRLRNHLRAHARQLGDVVNAGRLDHLIGECAYEHWHRMLFARFLAENHLLIEPESAVAITLEECEELAAQGGNNKWHLASLLAQNMLPQIFRPEDPLLQVGLPREYQHKLEKLLNDLEAVVFTADDAIGWVYQFWQTKRKKDVNDSGEKIGADTLAAVTQLFTEDYMVDFMLDNTLGAWWAEKQCRQEDFDSEELLRRKAALPGMPLQYLRLIKPDPTTVAGASGSGLKSDRDGPATPYAAWPKRAAELKCIDISCGSGHFLVALFNRLVALRVAEEGLSQAAAARAVLRDNLFGLEIDPRCTQIAAFNLALAAWKLDPHSVSDPLPALNISCCGLEISAAKSDWKALAPDQGYLMNQLWELFNNAATFGSLINPRKQIKTFNPGDIDKLETTVLKALHKSGHDYEKEELGVTAKGLTAAYKLLNDTYHLVATNVPYLARGKQNDTLKTFIETHYPAAKQDLATAFVERSLEFCRPGGTATLVTPQNWLFLGSYTKLREKLLKTVRWDWVTRLGTNAFVTISGEVVNVALLSLTQSIADESHQMAGLDVSQAKSAEEKAQRLLKDEVGFVGQMGQLGNPDGRIVFKINENMKLLIDYADSFQGICTGDYFQFGRMFWEQDPIIEIWKFQQSTVNKTILYSGRSNVFLWENGIGRLHQYLKLRLGKNQGAWIRGLEAWNLEGVCISQTGNLSASIYSGDSFDNNAAVIIPKSKKYLSAIWAFCSSANYFNEVRKIDQALKITNITLLKVPFDLAYWQKVAAERYPTGLPEPYSDDPTQWLFHGNPVVAGAPGSGLKPDRDCPATHNPATGTATLQVAVARLMGYRWPAELDPDMHLAKEARLLVKSCEKLLGLADDDGIVCIPPVRGEEPAAGRLRALLIKAFANEWHDHKELELIKSTGSSAADLDAWLRDEFFEQHCKLFHHRPFVWHIWDGRRRDGFHVLVNYHKLADGEKGRKLLENITHSYLQDWINRQKDGVKRGEAGAEDRLAAAGELQKRLIAILAGEEPFDIFVRWKPLHKQAIGWEPDINDGVRMNIRPFMASDLPNGRSGAGILRWKPNIKWDKDRGKEPERAKAEFPWFWENGTFTGNRVNDVHLDNPVKHKARDAITKT